MENIDKILETKYPITRGMSQKNCNKVLKARHYFKEGYVYAKNEVYEYCTSCGKLSCSCEYDGIEPLEDESWSGGFADNH